MRLMSLLAVVALGAASPAAAATSADLLKCQKTIHTKARAFVKTTETALLTCAQKVVECKLAQEIDAVDPTACLAAASTACGAITGKISTLKSTAVAKTNIACGLISLSDLNQFVEGLGFFNVSAGCGAGDASALVTCLFDDAQCSAERTVGILDPRAEDSFTAAGVAGSFPCVTSTTTTTTSSTTTTT